jgi:hypothetical protein
MKEHGGGQCKSVGSKSHAGTQGIGQTDVSGGMLGSNGGGGGAAAPTAAAAVHKLDSGELVCSICLEEVGAGEELLTLPCLHQYHVSCVRPWLTTQGRHALCPLCKTPVFM